MRNWLRTWFCVLTLLGVSFYANANGTLIKMLVRGSDNLVGESAGISRLLAPHGFDATRAAQLENYIRQSVAALNEGAIITTEAALRGRLTALDVTPEDLAVRQQLVALLDREATSLSKSDWTNVINGFMRLGNRYGTGRSTIMSCTSCVDDAFNQHGIDFVLRETGENPRVQTVMNGIPNNPRQVDRRINTWMRQLNVRGDLSLVKPEEKRTLAAFLAMAQRGSPANAVEREYIQAVMEISRRPNGQVHLVDADNSHNLWRLVAESNNGEQEFLANMTVALREAANEGSSQVSKKEAFFNAFARRAGDDPARRNALEDLRARDCYFN